MQGEQVTRTVDVSAELAALQDDYTYRVNMLLDEGREDLATHLADRYIEDAAAVIRHAAA